MGTHERWRAAATEAMDRAAIDWHGAEIVAPRAAAWLEVQLARCDDRAWAETFARHCPVPGAAVDDYLQRIVPVQGGHALIGIRMRGGDVAHPFVDVLLTAGEVELGAVVRAALADRAVFAPTIARVRSSDLAPPRGAGLVAEVDQWFLAAPLSAVSPPVAELRLVPIEDVDGAVAFVRAGLEAWSEQRGWLRGRVTPIDRASLIACRDAGAALWVVVDGARAGVICADRSVDREWAGWCVNEELIGTAHAGRRLAASAQGALAQQLREPCARDEAEPVLFGTIDGRNAPSLAAAERAGRRRVGAWWWLRSSDADPASPLPSDPG